MESSASPEKALLSSDLSSSSSLIAIPDNEKSRSDSEKEEEEGEEEKSHFLSERLSLEDEESSNFNSQQPKSNQEEKGLNEQLNGHHNNEDENHKDNHNGNGNGNDEDEEDDDNDDDKEEFKTPKVLPPLNIGWTQQLDTNERLEESFKTSFVDAMRLLPLGLRITKHSISERANGREPFIDPFFSKTIRGNRGIPIGTVGSGSITRGWQGDFCSFFIQPGRPTETPILADAFSLWVRRPGQQPIATALGSKEAVFRVDSARSRRKRRPFSSYTGFPNDINPLLESVSADGRSFVEHLEGELQSHLSQKSDEPPLSSLPASLSPNHSLNDQKEEADEQPKPTASGSFFKPSAHLRDGLHEWTWKHVAGEYKAIFPCAWTTYDLKKSMIDNDLSICCMQLSPFIPDNYVESSFPVGVFVWEIENTSATQHVDVSLMFSFQNGRGSDKDYEGGHFNVPFKRKIEIDSLSRDLFSSSSSSSGPPYHSPSASSSSSSSSSSSPSPSPSSSCDHSTDPTVSSSASSTWNSKESFSFSTDSESLQRLKEKLNLSKPHSPSPNSSSVLSVPTKMVEGVQLVHHNISNCPGSVGVPLEEQVILKPCAFSDPLSFGIATEGPIKFPSSKSNNHLKEEEPPIRNPPIDCTSSITTFETTGDGADVWNFFSRYGVLLEKTHQKDPELSIATRDSAIGAAVARRFRIEPLQKKRIVFSLAWDHPIVRFGSGRGYYRRYTRFYGRNGSCVAALCTDALRDWPQWLRAIQKWQSPILKNPSLPKWYRSALFNETYYLVAGGTIWLDREESAEERTLRSISGFEESSSASLSSLSVSSSVIPLGSTEGAVDLSSPSSAIPNNTSISSSTSSLPHHLRVSSMLPSNRCALRASSSVYTSASSPGAKNASSSSSNTSKKNKAESSDVIMLKPSLSNRGDSKALVQDFKELTEDLQTGVLLFDGSASRQSGVIAFGFEDLVPEKLYRTKRGFSVLRSLCGAVTLGDLLVISHKDPLRDSTSSLFNPSISINSSLSSSLSLSNPPFSLSSADPSQLPASVAQAAATGAKTASVLKLFPNDFGQLLYLESHEYLMYNTYDVHFYASFSLIQLFPQLELNLQREFARSTIMHRPKDLMQTLANGETTARKIRGAVPHDIGTPSEDPFYRPNSYRVHDISRWKDLNSKFVLQVYRDYLATLDIRFLKDVWPVVFEALLYLEVFDRDHDGMIENDDFPDQTYDTWDALGVSAYCGGLWLAALQAGASMASLLKCDEDRDHFLALHKKASDVYEKKLWNGLYYDYDSSGKKSDTLMADQTAGEWYARACNLPPVSPPERVISSLKQIFKFNVQRFRDGRMGAVNGYQPQRNQIDRSSMQSCEVWTGTTYAVAASMLQEGLKEEGWKTAQGMYLACYRDHGYMFQTPEALDPSGRYRAPSYMRPLSIWALQWAVDHVWTQSERVPYPYTISQ